MSWRNTAKSQAAKGRWSIWGGRAGPCQHPHFPAGEVEAQAQRAEKHGNRPWKLKFLGFSVYKAKAGKILIRLAPQTIDRVKTKIRAITARNTPVSMAERIERLNAYLGRWIGYSALAETPSIFETIEGWMRRRLRMCLWKQWKRVRTRYRELCALGLPEWVVHEFANARKGLWRMAHGPMNRALGNAYWQAQGLMSLTERYQSLRQAW